MHFNSGKLIVLASNAMNLLLSRLKHNNNNIKLIKHFHVFTTILLKNCMRHQFQLSMKSSSSNCLKCTFDSLSLSLVSKGFTISKHLSLLSINSCIKSISSLIVSPLPVHY